MRTIRKVVAAAMMHWRLILFLLLYVAIWGRACYIAQRYSEQLN
jgi:hypothetical protein